MAKVLFRPIEHPLSMLSQVFYRHGRFCASHPWEVIVAFLTLTISMLSMGTTIIGSTKVCDYKCAISEENKGVEVVLMTIARCMALLYGYHQFRKLYKLGSTYLVGIAGLFTVFSSFVFSTSVINFLDGDFSELNQALPFFFLLIDLTKAGLLAQFALSSSTQEEVRENIAQGMSVLGPTITLDTIVETLVIGVGTLSGVKRLEEMCCFACMSAVVNYFVFMAFFPACLSLILELSRDRDEARPVWHLSTLTRVLQQEEEQKPNPVLQRVKVIMSAGLVLVHAHSRWPLLVASNTVLEQRADISSPVDKLLPFPTDQNWNTYVQKCFAVSAEQMVILVLAGALAVKYLFFESRDELTEHLASAAISSPSRCIISKKGAFTSRTVQTQPIIESCSSLNQVHAFQRQANVPIVCHEVTMSQTSVQPSNKSHLPSQSFTFIVGGDDTSGLIPKSFAEKGVQTECPDFTEDSEDSSTSKPRSLEQCKEVLEHEKGAQNLTDEEIILLVENKIIPSYKLEAVVGHPERGVRIRRQLISKLANCGNTLYDLPFRNYNYQVVMGSCCENVIGYMPVPVGTAGPLVLDEEHFYVPMATTEGCLVASTNRGCRALSLSGGVRSYMIGDGMTRGPVIRMPSAKEASEIMAWLRERENFEILKKEFDSTSRFARLQKIHVRIAGRLVFIRFVASTGDAMGMNMLSKGSDKALNKLHELFPSVEILSVSGNYCTDKKPAAVNWIQGRGKAVVCEAKIPGKVVREVLKTDVASIVDVNISKNLIGSAVAGSVGGFNAQAANIVTAIYIATGQDPAQNVASSNCITILEQCGDERKDLYISCTMPSIEIGTIGGGTVLPAQASCLKLLGVKGSCTENPGQHSSKLARIVCATVLAGELSLLAALAEGHLVRSHMTHNRSSLNVQSPNSTVGQIPPKDCVHLVSSSDESST